MVDGGWVVSCEGEFAGGFERLAGGFGDSPHALLDHVEHLRREGSHRTLQFTGVGHYVGGLAGPDHGDRDHARIDRALIAGNDGLERLYDLAGHRSWIEAVVRHR